MRTLLLLCSLALSASSFAQKDLVIAVHGKAGMTKWQYAVTACNCKLSACKMASYRSTTEGPKQLTNSDFTEITWKSGDDGEDIYEVFRTETGGKPDTAGLICIIPNSVNSCSDVGLAADGTNKLSWQHYCPRTTR